MKKRLSNMEKKKIEEKVERNLEELGYVLGEDMYVDAVKLLCKHGFIVGESDILSSNDDGFIYVSPEEDIKIIGVNDNRSKEEKRFILMHELGHYQLSHKKDGRIYMHREHERGRNQIENDADYFAACILMPEKSFKNQYDYLVRLNTPYENILIALQDIFKTPIESIERRIKEVCNV